MEGTSGVDDSGSHADFSYYSFPKSIIEALRYVHLISRKRLNEFNTNHLTVITWVHIFILVLL